VEHQIVGDGTSTHGVLWLEDSKGTWHGFYAPDGMDFEGDGSLYELDPELEM
jgi:hypothetical protein